MSRRSRPPLSAGDFRVVTAIEVDGNGKPYWHMTWDNNANGTLPAQKFWDSYNTSVAVPQGQWAHVEFFTHRGTTDGETVLKVDGQVVFDHTGDTVGVNNAPVNRIFVASPYSNKPMDMLVDNVQVRDGMPDATSPAVASAAAVSTAVASPAAGTFKLSLSEDAWQGDARFSVAIDGKTIGAPQAVTALHSAGASQDFSFSQALSAGVHDVAVSFLNDAYGGSAATDRNLYVDGIAINGAAVGGATAALMVTSTQHFSATVPVNT